MEKSKKKQQLDGRGNKWAIVVYQQYIKCNLCYSLPPPRNANVWYVRLSLLFGLS